MPKSRVTRPTVATMEHCIRVDQAVPSLADIVEIMAQNNIVFYGQMSGADQSIKGTFLAHEEADLNGIRALMGQKQKEVA